MIARSFRRAPRLAACLVLALASAACSQPSTPAAASPTADAVTEPPSAIPEELARATVQLRRRFGDGYRIVDNVIEGQAVCGFVDPEGATRAGGPRPTRTFVSTPTTLSLSGETPGFEALLARSCPNLPARPAA